MLSNVILPFQVPLNEKELEMLGMISAAWSQFEFIVEISLLRALKLPLLTDQLPRDISLKLTKLKTFVETNVQSKPEKKRIIGLCDRGAVIAVKRNLAIHGKWALNASDHKPIALSWFKGTTAQPMSSLPASDLSKVLAEICEVTIDMRDALKDQGYFF